MALGECVSLEELDLFTGDKMADMEISYSALYETEDMLKSLREVNDDDTLSRVLSFDLPDARANTIGEDFEASVDSFAPFNDEVTLCANSSHVENVMSECISDGIEATDIGSLLEQFLEYEKAISPALSPVVSAFPTPVPSPGNQIQSIEECIMSDMKGQPFVFKKEKAKEQIPTPPITPVTIVDIEEDFDFEIPDFDIIIENQVVITTSTDDEQKLDESVGNQNQTSEISVESKSNIIIEDKSSCSDPNDTECRVRNENGLVVVEFVSRKSEIMENEEQKIEEKDDNEIKNKIKSVVGKAYRIPKRQKESKARSRSRSRSPLSKQSREQIMQRKVPSKSQGCNSDSGEDDVKERYERYRSERRTPMRKDDRRKRRKYSSCSDDEYDYYRYSKRRSDKYTDNRRNRQSPTRNNYEHDYNMSKSRSKEDRYQRSNSLRQKDVPSCKERRSHKNKSENTVDGANVHERMTELATPVPYDIEQERKIGFLCQGKRAKASLERRNVYAGGIRRTATKQELLKRFEHFGPIEKITLHFRERGDSYAFIVFEDSKDAMLAVEEGNVDPNFDRLDLCFGGRRKFVGGSYVDFDANTSYLEENDLATTNASSPAQESEFDALLKMARKEHI